MIKYACWLGVSGKKGIEHTLVGFGGTGGNGLLVRGVCCLFLSNTTTQKQDLRLPKK